MTVRFAPEPVAQSPSLAYQLDAGPNVRWRRMTACQLTYEENEPEHIEVFVATKRRYGTVDAMEEITYDNLNGAFAI